MLREALPYLKQFSGKTFIIKAGGQVMESPDFPQLIQDVATLYHIGIKVVFVFGAGPQLDLALSHKNIPFEKRGGRRVTTAEMIPVLNELIDADYQKISQYFREDEVEPELISNFLTSEKIHSEDFPENHFTGEVKTVDAERIEKLFDEQKLPVCFSLVGEYNCNADDITLSLAKELKAEKVLFLTGTKGVFIAREEDGEPELLSSATPHDIEKYITRGDISGGMIPKVRAATAVYQAGVPRVHIISGLLDGTLLTEIFTPHGTGTMVAKEIEAEEA